MPDTILLVDYFYIEAPDKPGEGVHALSYLKEAGVNLLALHAFPKGRRTQVDFVPSDPAAFKAAAKAAKWKIAGPRKLSLFRATTGLGLWSSTSRNWPMRRLT